MKIIDTQNVNTAVAAAIPFLLKDGIAEESRNGRVLVAPEPVVTIYRKPLERVLFSATRDANPFFHLFESLWMLAGRNDLAFPAQFNKRFPEYSDDGKIVWGAYGWRWREFFGYDQLEKIVEELRRNPTSRRCVLSMWNGMEHLESNEHTSDLFIAMGGGKDVPCNTHAYFDVRGGVLNMTVCCRSNDAIWGAYGANAVHFSILLEYMAEQLGVPAGVYRQISNNFHAYPDFYGEEKLRQIGNEADIYNLYAADKMMKPIPLDSASDHWQEDLALFLQDGTYDIRRKSFFSQVATPMYQAWFAWKKGDYDAVHNFLQLMPFCDWQVAAIEWMERRRKGMSNAA